MTDDQIVDRVRAGETALFEMLMRRHNQRIYRVVRAVLKDEGEAEDAMQQAYINAFVHLNQFQGGAQFTTWLTRIAIHEALARRRKWRPDVVDPPSGEGDHMDRLSSDQPDPERQTYARQLARVLERAVDALPESYRSVFMLREIEGLSTRETAEGLELGEEAVKTRLHRARALVRRAVTDQIGVSTAEAFAFHAPRCDRVVSAVMGKISQATPVRC